MEQSTTWLPDVVQVFLLKHSDCVLETKVHEDEEAKTLLSPKTAYTTTTTKAVVSCNKKDLLSTTPEYRFWRQESSKAYGKRWVAGD